VSTIGNTRRAGRIAVVVNPRSGNGRTGKRWPTMGASLREAVGAYTLMLTESPGHATTLVRQALREGHDRIISVGGDGTHNEVVNGFFEDETLINPEASLAIVPAGTGSDLARTLRLPWGVDALPYVVDGMYTRADIGRVRYTTSEGDQAVRYFINIADFGAGGEVVKRVNSTSKFFGGFLSFLWGVISTLVSYENPEIQLEIDGVELEGRINNVIVANGQYYGGGMHVAPHARLDSRAFDVYVIGDVGKTEAVINLPKLYRGRLLRKPDKVRYFRASRILADSSQEVLLNLDGEQPGKLPIAIQLLPSVLNVVVG